MEEEILEDMSCLLGSGEVPNLFTADEEAGVVDRLRDTMRAGGKPDTRVSIAQCRICLIRMWYLSAVYHVFEFPRQCNYFCDVDPVRGVRKGPQYHF